MTHFAKYELAIPTKRLLLRFPLPKEEEAIVDLTFSAAHTSLNGRGFTDGMTWDPPTTKDDTREFIRLSRSAWDEGVYNFVIFLKDSTPIGRVVLRKGKKLGVWVIGYWLHPNYHGYGYMTEVAKAVLVFGFTQVRCKKIIGKAAYWNHPSQKILCSIGLLPIEKGEDYGVVKNGKFIQQYLYALTLDQYLAGTRP